MKLEIISKNNEVISSEDFWEARVNAEGNTVQTRDNETSVFETIYIFRIIVVQK